MIVNSHFDECRSHRRIEEWNADVGLIDALLYLIGLIVDSVR
jgi:hypothetical protein